MNVPPLDGIDHVHVYVADRARSETWYARVLGMRRLPELESWAVHGGPLTLADAGGTVHLALFEARDASTRTSCATIALTAGADALLAWQSHLQAVLGRDVALVDHALTWSIYFTDPDGNPYEITSYAHAAVAAAVRRGVSGAHPPL